MGGEENRIRRRAEQEDGGRHRAEKNVPLPRENVHGGELRRRSPCSAAGARRQDRQRAPRLLETVVRHRGKVSGEDSGVGKSECLISPTVGAESGEVAAEAREVASKSGDVSESGKAATEARSPSEKVVVSASSKVGHGEGWPRALQLAVLGVNVVPLAVAVHGVVPVDVDARAVHITTAAANDAVRVSRFLVEGAVAPRAALHVRGRAVGVPDHLPLHVLSGAQPDERGEDDQLRRAKASPSVSHTRPTANIMHSGSTPFDSVGLRRTFFVS